MKVVNGETCQKQLTYMINDAPVGEEVHSTGLLNVIEFWKL